MRKKDDLVMENFTYMMKQRKFNLEKVIKQRIAALDKRLKPDADGRNKMSKHYSRSHFYRINNNLFLKKL